jgi:excisionase family DNA binding protein
MLKTKIPQPEPLLLRGREVAELIGCSRALAYRLMQRGVIPTVRIPGGKSVRVPREALIEWIRANTKPPCLFQQS